MHEEPKGSSDPDTRRADNAADSSWVGVGRSEARGGEKEGEHATGEDVFQRAEGEEEEGLRVHGEQEQAGVAEAMAALRYATNECCVTHKRALH